MPCCGTLERGATVEILRRRMVRGLFVREAPVGWAARVMEEGKLTLPCPVVFLERNSREEK
jgi:hypothetical protein